MGVVYRALHEQTRAPAAVKTVRLRSQSHMTSIRRELHALRELRHPGVVRILAQGIDRNLPWYAMELLQGETLADYDRRLWESRSQRPVAAAGRLSEVLTIARRICDPLGFLHGEGIVHADLKPGNVFLGADGRPILFDFGLSRRVGPHGREIADLPALGGTPAYMAPHQITGDLLEPRDDLYSLGCILYKLITGRLPFPGHSTTDTVWRHLREPPRLPSALVADVPAALDQLVLSLLEKDPRDRPGHPDDVAEVLEELGASPGSSGHRSSRACVYRPRLIGREAPLSELMTLVHGLQFGQGAVAVIAGESGIGKTYLALEVSRRAAWANMHVVNGSCVPGSVSGSAGGGSPLHPFRELLLSVADRCASGGHGATERLLGNRARVLVSIAPALAGLPGVSGLPDPPPLSGAAARDRLLGGLVETISAFARERPLVLVLDDLQWADELTWRALGLLARQVAPCAPLLVLGTYRSDEATFPPGGALEQLPSRLVRIGRLDRSAIGSLVADMLAVEHPPDDFVESLARQSEGNPFFVAEYLRAAMAEGLVRRLGRHSLEVGVRVEGSIGKLHVLPFPATLRELVSRRLGGLSRQAQDRVQLAAVIGRELDGDVLDAAGGVDDSATTELLSRQVLESLGAGTLRFTHDKLREIAYERIPADWRARLHFDVAEALERTRASRPDFAASSAVLARHYLTAGRTAKAVDYFSKAGEHALSVGAHREAIGFLEQCLELEDGSGGELGRLRRVRWHRQLGDAFTGTGNLGARLREAGQAIATAGDHASVPLVVALPRALLLLARQRIRAGFLRRTTSQRRQQARELHLELARAHSHLAVVHYFQNDPVPMVVRLIDAVEHAERAGPSAELSGAYAETGAVFGIGGFARAGERYLRDAVAIARQIGDQWALSYALMIDCLYAVGVGRWGDVRRSADECQSICERISDHVNWGNAQIVRFWMHHYRAETEDSLRAAHDLLARARRIGNHQQEVWGLCSAGLAELRRERPAEALRHLEAALAAHEDSDENNLVLTLGCAALARMRLGDAPRAQEDARTALDMLIRVRRPTGHATLEGCSAIAEVMLRAAEPQLEVSSLAVEALRRYRKAFPIGEARYRLWRGVLLAHRQRQRLAVRSWRRGIEAARALSMRFDEDSIEGEIEAATARV